MTDGDEASALVGQAAVLGVDLDHRRAVALLAFRDLLLHWNRAFNLVSRADTARLVPRHLLDSLTAAPWLIGSSVLDVGTGAGLPGVPLAIAREDVQVTLIDLSERKIRFVDRAVRALGLGNVSTRCGDVAALAPAERFDTVVSRAVADSAAIWGLIASHLNPEGRLVVMSRARGAAGQPAPEPPAGSRLEASPRVWIPGLQGPHELMVLGHADRTGSSA